MMKTEKEEELDKKIFLQSSDGELYEIDSDVVSMCATVKNMLKGKSAFRNSLGGQFSIDGSYVILKKEGRVLASLMKNNDEEAVVSLPDVKSATLEKVIDYCKFHNNPATTEREKKTWDTDFVQVKQSVLCELASASYYLDIKPLVNLTSRAIATQISASSLATRCRLQRKINRKKPEENSTGTTHVDDNRSVEELLEFIEDPKPNGKKNSKAIHASSSSDVLSTSSPSTSPKLAPKSKKNKKKKGKNSNKDENVDTQEADLGQSTETSSYPEAEKDNNDDPHNDGIRGSTSSLIDQEDTLSSVSSTSSAEMSPDLREDIDTDTHEESQFWEDEEDDLDLDPKMKADLDKEVEEFRLRLESMSAQNEKPKPKLTLPISSSSFVNSLGVGVH